MEHKNLNRVNVNNFSYPDTITEFCSEITEVRVGTTPMYVARGVQDIFTIKLWLRKPFWIFTHPRCMWLGMVGLEEIEIEDCIMVAPAVAEKWGQFLRRHRKTSFWFFPPNLVNFCELMGRFDLPSNITCLRDILILKIWHIKDHRFPFSTQQEWHETCFRASPYLFFHQYNVSREVKDSWYTIKLKQEVADYSQCKCFQQSINFDFCLKFDQKVVMFDGDLKYEKKLQNQPCICVLFQHLNKFKYVKVTLQFVNRTENGDIVFIIHEDKPPINKLVDGSITLFIKFLGNLQKLSVCRNETILHLQRRLARLYEIDGVCPVYSKDYVLPSEATVSQCCLNDGQCVGFLPLEVHCKIVANDSQALPEWFSTCYNINDVKSVLFYRYGMIRHVFVNNQFVRDVESLASFKSHLLNVKVFYGRDADKFCRDDRELKFGP